MALFPSVITTFTNPNPSDKLNSPSHSGIETAQNNELIQIENVIGTGASVLGTIIGDLRNTNSGGGGHIQSANKGGTGQTSYVKGDLLAASSSSVLSKLTVGTNGYALVADSTQSVGIKWADVVTAPALKLVSYTTGSGTPASATSLDLDTDLEYMFIFEDWTTSTQHDLTVKFNNDTSTNYFFINKYEDGSSSGTIATNTATYQTSNGSFKVNTPTGGSYSHRVEFHVRKRRTINGTTYTGVNWIANSYVIAGVSASNFFYQVRGTGEWETNANVTEVDFIQNANTSWQLWVFKTAQA